MKPQALPVNHFPSGMRTPVDQYGRSDSILTTAGPSLSTSGQTLGEPKLEAQTDLTTAVPNSLPVQNLGSAIEINQDRDYNLNSSFGNIQIDLTNLGAILGSTSITVGEPLNQPVDKFNQSANDLSDYKWNRG